MKPGLVCLMVLGFIVIVYVLLPKGGPPKR